MRLRSNKRRGGGTLRQLWRRRLHDAPDSPARAQGTALLAGMFFVVGLMWLFALSDSAGDTRPTTGLGPRSFRTIYLLFGIWPPVVVWWIGGTLGLVQAWRLRRAAKLEEAQSHAIVAASPTNSVGVSAPGNAARLYWSLATLVAVIAALCTLTTLVGIAPTLPPGPFSKRLAYGFSALAAALVIAGVVLKPECLSEPSHNRPVSTGRRRRSRVQQR